MFLLALAFVFYHNTSPATKAVTGATFGLVSLVLLIVLFMDYLEAGPDGNSTLGRISMSFASSLAQTFQAIQSRASQLTKNLWPHSEGVEPGQSGLEAIPTLRIVTEGPSHVAALQRNDRDDVEAALPMIPTKARLPFFRTCIDGLWKNRTGIASGDASGAMISTPASTAAIPRSSRRKGRVSLPHPGRWINRSRDPTGPITGTMLASADRDELY